MIGLIDTKHDAIGHHAVSLCTTSHLFHCHSGVKFTIILRATFAPKSFCQKITNPNYKHIKAAHKILVKLTPGCQYAKCHSAINYSAYNFNLTFQCVFNGICQFALPYRPCKCSIA